MLDTARTIETPEGVGLELRPAGPVVRGMAWGIDLLIRTVVYVSLWVLLGNLERFGIGVFLVFLFVLEWFYPVVFEVYADGATPGKSVMKVRVVQDDGIAVGWTASMIRNLLRAVDFLPFMYAFGLVSVLAHRDFKRLGDLAAGTLVVYRDAGAPGKTIPPASALAPKLSPSRDQQQAVLAFAERSRGMPAARAEELADLAVDLTGRRGAAGVEALHRIANWLER